MPATRLQVYHDPVPTLSTGPVSAPGPQTRRASARLGASALGVNAKSTTTPMPSLPSHLKGAAARRTVSARAVLQSSPSAPSSKAHPLSTSLITTNISTITIDDKENIDPLTGLPLSSLLSYGKKSKSAKSSPRSSSEGVVVESGGQRYLATTITTTILSPLPPIVAKEKKTKGRKRVGSDADAENAPASRTIELEEGMETTVPLITGGESRSPRRSPRIASHTHDPSSSPITPARQDDETKPKTKRAPASTAVRSIPTRSFSSPPFPLSDASSSGSTSPLKTAQSIALARHTASVVTAAFETHEQAVRARLRVAEDGDEQSTIEVESDSHAISVSVSPRATKKAKSSTSSTTSSPLRRSPRKSTTAASSPAGSPATKTKRGGVRVTEILPTDASSSSSIASTPVKKRRKTAAISPRKIPLPASPLLSSIELEADEPSSPGSSYFDMDVTLVEEEEEMDVQIETLGNEAETAAAVQRIIDAKCKDLTMMPLGDLSAAYGQSSS